jgi:hypothetical protein
MSLYLVVKHIPIEQRLKIIYWTERLIDVYMRRVG